MRVGASIHSGQPLDELLAPLVDHAVQPLAYALRQAAQRVAVQVEPVLVGDDEALAELRQRILAVQLRRFVAGQSHAVTAFHSGLAGSR